MSHKRKDRRTQTHTQAQAQTHAEHKEGENNNNSQPRTYISLYRSQSRQLVTQHNDLHMLFSLCRQRRQCRLLESVSFYSGKTIGHALPTCHECMTFASCTCAQKAASSTTDCVILFYTAAATAVAASNVFFFFSNYVTSISSTLCMSRGKIEEYGSPLLLLLLLLLPLSLPPTPLLLLHTSDIEREITSSNSGSFFLLSRSHMHARRTVGRTVGRLVGRLAGRSTTAL